MALHRLKTMAAALKLLLYHQMILSDLNGGETTSEARARIHTNEKAIQDLDRDIRDLEQAERELVDFPLDNKDAAESSAPDLTAWERAVNWHNLDDPSAIQRVAEAIDEEVERIRDSQARRRDLKRRRDFAHVYSFYYDRLYGESRDKCREGLLLRGKRLRTLEASKWAHKDNQRVVIDLHTLKEIVSDSDASLAAGDSFYAALQIGFEPVPGPTNPLPPRRARWPRKKKDRRRRPEQAIAQVREDDAETTIPADLDVGAHLETPVRRLEATRQGSESTTPEESEVKTLEDSCLDAFAKLSVREPRSAGNEVEFANPEDAAFDAFAKLSMREPGEIATMAHVPSLDFPATKAKRKREIDDHDDDNVFVAWR